MTIKTVTSYVCAFFAVLVIILSLATNYWLEYEVVSTRSNGVQDKTRSRQGLWETCVKTKTLPDGDYGDEDCYDSLPDDLISNWEDKRNVVVAFYIIALLVTLLAFIFVTIYCVTDKYYFPVTRSAIFFIISAICVIISLSVYTNSYMNHNVEFSWSYGAGWSAAAMYLISVILLCADK